MQILAIGITMGVDTTNARAKNCGRIVPRFVGISGNCGKINARTAGEKSLRIAESCGMIDENYSAMRGRIDGKRPDGDVRGCRTNQRDERRSEDEAEESQIPCPGNVTNR